MRNRIFPPYYSCRYGDSAVRDWLTDFEAWLTAANYTLMPSHSLTDVDLKDIDRWVDHWAQYVGRSSLMKRIGYLRCFIRFCRDRGEIGLCADQIDTPRQYRDEKPPRAIAWDMTQRLLSSIDRS